jgi:TP901 family phage tail tape measure protein
VASAGAIRAGAAFVEIFANDSKLQQTLTRVQARMRAFGTTMRNAGASMALTGAAIKVPLLLAGQQAAGFEDAILAMKGAAGLSADQVARLSDAAKDLGTQMGASPTKIANAFLELAKAGMTVDEVLNGAGKSAVEFAKVGAVDAEQAAVFMKAAMNVFGTTAEEAVDTLTAAANSSETSISAMVESFSQVGSAGQAFNQSLFGVSQAMAVLAKSNIVGEEAGTAIKTMLTKLVAPTDDAKEALAVLGLQMADFRDEAGKLLPMAQIAGVFERALQGMGDNALDLMTSQKALVDVFEQRGIKVITAFANVGEKGFEKVAQEMSGALPVAEQFKISMSGISGQVNRLATAVELMSIAFGEAISGPLKETTDFLVDMMAHIARLIEDFPMLAVGAAGVGAALVAMGVAAIAAGVALRGLAAAQATVLALQGPKGWAILGVAALITGGFALASAYGDAGKEIDKARQKVEEFEAAAGGQNQAKPDQFRKPLDKALVDKQAAAEELAKADVEFDESQQDAIRKITEMRNEVVDAVDGLGDEALRAGARFQSKFAEIIDMLDRGTLNAAGAEALGKQLQKQLETELEIIREGMNPKVVAPDYGRSVGTFGTSGAGFGVGPEMAPVLEGARPGGVVPAAAAGMDGRAGDARAGRDVAADTGAAGARLQSSIDQLAKAISEQTKVVEAGNSLLGKIATNTGRPGAVFA